MAVAYDASASGGFASVATGTVSITIGSGTGRKLIVFAAMETTNTPSISAVTFDPAGGDETAGLLLNGGEHSQGDTRLDCWYVDIDDGVAAAAYDVKVDLNATADNLVIGIIALDDAEIGQPQATRYTAATSTTTISPQVVTMGDDCIVVEGVTGDTIDTWSPDDGQTERIDVADSGSAMRFAASTNVVASPALTDTGWTAAGSQARIVHVSIVVSTTESTPSAPSATSPLPSVRILGTSLADGITLSASDETISVDNLQDTDARSVWKGASGNGRNQEWFQGTFAASSTVNALHLENVNFNNDAVLCLQLSDDGFSTIKSNTRFQKWQKDLTFKSATLWLPSNVTATDFRIVMVDPTNTNGRQVGRLKIGQYFDAPNSENVEIGPNFAMAPQGELVEMRSGGYRAEQKPRRRQVSVTWDFAHDDDNWSIDANSFAELLEEVGYEDDMLIAVYPEQYDDRDRRHTILGRMIQNTGLQGNFLAKRNGTVYLYSRLGITVSEAL